MSNNKNMPHNSFVLLFALLCFGPSLCLAFLCADHYTQKALTPNTPCQFSDSIFTFAMWKAVGKTGTPNFVVWFIDSNSQSPIYKSFSSASDKAFVTSFGPFVDGIVTNNFNFFESVDVDIIVVYVPLYAAIIGTIILFVSVYCCCACWCCCCNRKCRNFDLCNCLCCEDREREERRPLKPQTLRIQVNTNKTPQVLVPIEHENEIL